MSEHDVDENEQAEAEALAQALEGSARDGAPPEDALQTAALLRYSGDEGQLAPDKADSVLAGLDDVAIPKAAATRRWWQVWLPLGVGVAAAAALVLVLLREPETAPVQTAAPTRTELPAPGAALLSAQAELAHGEAPRFEDEMRGYREDLLRSLERAYPLSIGMLVHEEPAP